MDVCGPGVRGQTVPGPGRARGTHRGPYVARMARLAERLKTGGAGQKNVDWTVDGEQEETRLLRFTSHNGGEYLHHQLLESHGYPPQTRRVNGCAVLHFAPVLLVTPLARCGPVAGKVERKPFDPFTRGESLPRLPARTGRQPAEFRASSWSSSWSLPSGRRGAFPQG